MTYRTSDAQKRCDKRGDPAICSLKYPHFLLEASAEAIDFIFKLVPNPLVKPNIELILGPD